MTPYTYDASADELKVNTGITRYITNNLAWSSIAVVVGLCGVHVLNVYNGLVTFDDLLLASAVVPTYLINIALGLTFLLYAHEFVYIINNMLELNRTFCKFQVVLNFGCCSPHNSGLPPPPCRPPLGNSGRPAGRSRIDHHSVFSNHCVSAAFHSLGRGLAHYQLQRLFSSRPFRDV